MSRHSTEHGFDPDPITEPIPALAPPEPATRRSMSRRVRALMSVGIVLGLGSVSTLAAWSATSATTSGQFTTGTVSIVANGSATYTFSFPGSLLPGDSTAALITVGNVGSVPFTYSAAVSSPSALVQATTMTVRAGAGAAVSGTSCTGGTLVTSGASITGTATTFSTGRGPLAATSGTEPMCVQLTLSPSAAAGLAATSGSALLTFTASS